jgi:enoyl-CoA hydratase/carnithine racemase
MSYETLELERRGETLIVRLNRPEKLNAVTPLMVNDLTMLCRELRTDQ